VLISRTLVATISRSYCHIYIKVSQTETGLFQLRFFLVGLSMTFTSVVDTTIFSNGIPRILRMRITTICDKIEEHLYSFASKGQQKYDTR
jgi:hypothetical protein